MHLQKIMKKPAVSMRLSHGLYPDGYSTFNIDVSMATHCLTNSGFTSVFVLYGFCTRRIKYVYLTFSVTVSTFLKYFSNVTGEMNSRNLDESFLAFPCQQNYNILSPPDLETCPSVSFA